MNPRQRQGIILLAVAGLGAVAATVMLLNFVADVASQVGPTVTVLQLQADVGAQQPVEAAASAVEIPERWAPQQAFRETGEIQGLVAVTDLPAGSLLQGGMLVPPQPIAPGERLMTIMVGPDMGAGSAMVPGSLVDIVGAFRAEDGQPPEVRLIMEAARVVSAGADVPLPVDEGEQGAEGEEAGDTEPAPGDTVPVTFALSFEDAVRLTYVQDLAGGLRMFLRPTGDVGAIPDAARSYQLTPGEDV